MVRQISGLICEGKTVHHFETPPQGAFAIKHPSTYFSVTSIVSMRIILYFFFCRFGEYVTAVSSPEILRCVGDILLRLLWWVV